MPELSEAWHDCKMKFGKENVLIVSNSAGTSHDAGDIKAEAVTHHLGAPVLRHRALKPSYSCIEDIRNYFASLPDPVPDAQLVVIGDRIFTDVVLANRMRSSLAPPSSSVLHREGDVRPSGPLSVFVAKIWRRESMVARYLEKATVRLVEKFVGESELATRTARDQQQRSFVQSSEITER